MPATTTATGTNPPQWTTPLAAQLLQNGLSDATVQVLVAYHPNADQTVFLAGLDWLTAATKTLAQPTDPAPTEEPWATLAQAVQNKTAGDIMDAVLGALAAWAPDLQGAVYEALNERDAFLTARRDRQKQRKRQASTAEYLRVLTDLGYSFRQNDLNDIIEVNGAPISDNLAALIRAQMRDRGYEYVNIMEDAYVADAYVKRYHPVRSYLDSLTYDGSDHITRLASYFQDRDGAFPLFLRRWLIGAVAKVRAAEQNPVFVLDGPQGQGKSYFAEWLASVTAKDLFYEGPIDPEDKDSFVRLAAKWIWEVSELGATQRRADRESLKSFITMRTVTVRRAYGRFDMVKPALASFLGTVNNEGGILNDPTGSRRFLVVKMLNIDFAYSTAIDPAQVWAEANAAYLAGESWKLQPDELSLARRINDDYEIDEPLEGMLLKYFRVQPGNRLTWTPSSEIINTLESMGLHGQTRSNAMTLAAIATKLGVERKRRANPQGQLVWGYVGVTPI